MFGDSPTLVAATSSRCLHRHVYFHTRRMYKNRTRVNAIAFPALVILVISMFRDHDEQGGYPRSECAQSKVPTLNGRKPRQSYFKSVAWAESYFSNCGKHLCFLMNALIGVSITTSEFESCAGDQRIKTLQNIVAWHHLLKGRFRLTQIHKLEVSPYCLLQYL